MRCGNPVLNDRSFPRTPGAVGAGQMTIERTVDKTMRLLGKLRD